MKHSTETRITVVATLLLGLLGQAATAAESEGGDDGKSYRWGLGLGGGVQRKAYQGIDDDTIVLPLIYFENRWVRVFGGNIDLKLPSAGPVEFTLAARYARDGYEASDSRFLAGMQEREGSAWVGATATWSNPVATISAEWLTDVMSNSEGQQFKLELQRQFEAGKFGFTPRLALSWMDSKFVDYYYGVTAVEARANRAFYQGEATTGLEIGIRTSYSLDARQTVFVDIAADVLGSEIKDSPLVDQSNQSRLLLGYMYMF